MADSNPSLASRKKLVGGTEETTSGTFATVSVALASTTVDQITCEADDFFGQGAREPQGNFVGQVDSLVGKQTGTLSFRVMVRPGDKTLAMLTGCGMALATGTYAFSSDMTARKTWSFKVWEGGRMKSLAGCAGTVVFEVDVAGILYARFTWRGVWRAPTDEAMPSFAPPNAACYVGKGLTLTFAGSAIPHSNRLSLDFGNTVEEREDISNSKGVAHFWIGERKPRLEVDPEARLVAGHDAYGLMLAGTTLIVALVFTSGATTLTFGAPRAQRIRTAGSERGKRLVDGVTLQLNGSTSGDDELTIAEA